MKNLAVLVLTLGLASSIAVWAQDDVVYRCEMRDAFSNSLIYGGGGEIIQRTNPDGTVDYVYVTLDGRFQKHEMGTFSLKWKSTEVSSYKLDSQEVFLKVSSQEDNQVYILIGDAFQKGVCTKAQN